MGLVPPRAVGLPHLSLARRDRLVLWAILNCSESADGTSLLRLRSLKNGHLNPSRRL